MRFFHLINSDNVKFNSFGFNAPNIIILICAKAYTNKEQKSIKGKKYGNKIDPVMRICLIKISKM